LEKGVGGVNPRSAPHNKNQGFSVRQEGEVSRFSGIKVQQRIVFSRIVQCMEGTSSSKNPEKSTFRWLEGVPKGTGIRKMNSEGARVIIRVGKSCKRGRPLDVVEVRATRPDILLIKKEV